MNRRPPVTGHRSDSSFPAGTASGGSSGSGRSLTMTTSTYDGFWQNERYTFQSADGSVIAPVGAQLPRAVVVALETNDQMGDADEVSILAWAGEHEVAAVEITADDGQTWHLTERVDADTSPHTWTRFRGSLPAGLPATDGASRFGRSTSKDERSPGSRRPTVSATATTESTPSRFSSFQRRRHDQRQGDHHAEPDRPGR